MGAFEGGSFGTRPYFLDRPGLCVSLGSIIRSPSSASSKGFVLRPLGLPGSYPVVDGLHVILLVTLSGGRRDCWLGTRCPRSGRTGPAITTPTMPGSVLVLNRKLFPIGNYMGNYPNLNGQMRKRLGVP